MNQWVKSSFAALLGGLISFSALAGHTIPTPTTTTQNLNRIVAVVNNQVITQSQLNTAMTNAKMRISHSNMLTPPPGILESQVLKGLIYQRLQMQMVKRFGITVSNAQVDAALASVAKRNHISIAAMRREIESKGTRFSAYKANIKQQLQMQILQQRAVGSNINVSPEDVAALRAKLAKNQSMSTQYHVVDVFIPVNNTQSKRQLTQAKTQAETIEKALIAGDSFKQIAQTNQNAQINDMNWRPAASLPSLFVNRVSALQQGGVTTPILAPNGFHVLKLEGKQGSSSAMPSFEQLQQMAFQQKMQKALITWLKKLRANAYVKVYL